jgi:ATP-dependent Lhr-like helicase
VKRDFPQALHRIESWFAANGWQAFDFQREVWRAYLDGESGLVHSATGSGKTLAASLGPLVEWIEEQESPSQGEGPGKARALRVLWLTPMRALAGDTVLSIDRAVKDSGCLTVGNAPAIRAPSACRYASFLGIGDHAGEPSLMLSNADAREKPRTAPRGGR